ncbi:MAG: hypothetical protein A2X46_07250 [Lentisphaerae bacterium GWF2_57_35]|nr:MAG: hypothetical protein A2X46_07250 [Lentisphaerae bacterium GWF2_57_35]
MKLIQPRRFHPLKTLWVFGVLIAVLVYTTLRAAPGPDTPSWSGKTMGSTYSIKLAQSTLSEKRLDELKQAVETRLHEIDLELSHYRPDSEISQFNFSSSTAPFKVSASLANVVRFALDLNRQSGGDFDPTLGPLIDIWGFGPDRRLEKIPSDEEIAQAKMLTGCEHLRVTDANEIQKDIPPLRLNLNAVGNGYGADEVARVIQSFGISNLFVEVAGEVVVRGHNPNRERWRIGIDVPSPGHLPGEKLEAILHLTDLAVATSGDYRNFITDEKGKRYSHIFDPQAGRPIIHNLASVTVVASNALTADGLSTTLYVMGAEKGKQWIEHYPGAAALFTLRHPDGTFYQVISAGFETMTDCEFMAEP